MGLAVGRPRALLLLFSLALPGLCLRVLPLLTLLRKLSHHLSAIVPGVMPPHDPFCAKPSLRLSAFNRQGLILSKRYF